jgi:hypothetical protein
MNSYNRNQFNARADRDAEAWQESFSKWHYKALIKAKESGDLHHINANGDVIIDVHAKEVSNEKD